MPFSTNFICDANDPDALLTERQAASLLNMSMRTLQDWRLKRKGPVWVKCGMSVRYRRRDLLSFIDDSSCEQEVF